MAKIKKIGLSLVFLCLLIGALIGFNNMFKLDKASWSYQTWHGFYNEKPGSLDAVYIGSSNVHAFWQPPLAWSDYGIAVRSLSIDALPIPAVLNLIKEAQKTQPDALYIINLNEFKSDSFDDTVIHKTTNHMAFSRNKIETIDRLADEAGIDRIARLEFLFPFVRFHSRWSELNSYDLTGMLDPWKMGLTYPPYLSETDDLFRLYKTSFEETAPEEKQLSLLNELLDYCDERSLSVLFVTVPQVMEYEQQGGQITAMEKIVQERGYPCVDLLTDLDLTDIQPDTDFYNKSHTNVHGALKFTKYLGQYLIDHYGFSDKRGQNGWESWDEAAELYYDEISPYILPFERTCAPRDYSVESPEILEIEAEEGKVRISWSSVKNADSYEIYRKSGTDEDDKGWGWIASVSDGTLEYTDEPAEIPGEYVYTVNAARRPEGTTYYGKSDPIGTSITTR